MSDQLTHDVIGAAMEVHSALGPGLLESAYQSCLFYELRSRGLYVEAEKKLPVKYKELEIDQGYRMDLIVNNELVIELKTVEALNDIHLAQILTYLKFGGYKKGLLINFHVKSLRQGIKRVML